MLGVIVASESHLPDINRSAGDFASWAIFGEFGRFDHFCSVTVTEQVEPIAAIILHDWNSETGVIELSGAGSGKWQSRRVLNVIFGLCFDAMGCQMVVMRNKASNTKAIRNSERLGFSGQIVRRLGGRHEDMWVFTLTDDEWETHRLNTSRNKAILNGDAAPVPGLHDREATTE